MTVTMDGLAVTDDMVRKMIRHQQRIGSIASQITAAEIALAEAATTRLERKHKLDQLKGELRKLVEQGPDAVEEVQGTLFGDEEIEPIVDDLDQLKLPPRMVKLIRGAGIQTIKALKDVWQGMDEEYPEGIEDIPGADSDAVTRISSVLRDRFAEKAAIDVVVHKSPASDDPVVAYASSSHVEQRIRLLKTIGEGMNEGVVVNAEILETGDAIMLVDGESYSAMTGEYELVG